MSKKHKAPQLQQNIVPSASGGSAPAQPPAAGMPEPVPPALDGQSATEPSMRKYLFVFWIAVALAVAAAWTLEYFMPLTHEYIIERWIMLAFGGFLVVFLFFLK
ncbi:MAG: hypothetical protein A2X34_03020 [Elusimicrobia bacterium GWC2_51_8]|nr:MAG: hypothetical protein A2X33_03985 [Elusimicrobia bacterium GWA2_51_34]OGR60661.1 MAG: hypothetical protein A2X34_03020 [Elusimicrobia bacterium GWC2_51_8]OGR84472.1 MAG: hypothetical protein A2021_01775 [Elusimicrobia bacterium GWF2_52_66]HAF96532.1 hypothetical protein [Elusimicrobiota bacterium]HCE97610.1 hypothetical protein [Elusimicrobiota bacterium]